MLGKFEIESVSPGSLSGSDIFRIFEIEQDMWARGIGEYLKCSSCTKIVSKNAMYGECGEHPLDMSLRRKTVMQIEEILGYIPKCSCGGEMSHVYQQQEYTQEIRDRYSIDKSFLTLAYDESGRIVGFMDGYIETLQEIFQREFQFHFSRELLEKIMKSFNVKADSELLTFSSLGTDDENKNLQVILGLLRTFFMDMDDVHNNIPSIFESIIGSSTYSIFKIMGAESMGIQEHKECILPGSMNPNVLTDILFQEGVVESYKKGFNISARDIVRHSRNSIKK